MEIKFKLKRKHTNVNARRMIIVGRAKVGKTECLTALPNSLLLDLEGGSGFIQNENVVDLKQIALDNSTPAEKVTVMDVFPEVLERVRKDPPDYLIVDTITEMEQLGKKVGLLLYKNTPMGKNFKGDDILSLPNGSGYLHLRNGFDKIDEMLEDCYKKAIIYIAHPKRSSLIKEGGDLSARDINLTGSLKIIACAKADAIGFIRRNKGSNQNILSFKTNEQDLVTGARPKHLRGQEFLISELQEDGTLVTHWDKIFI